MTWKRIDDRPLRNPAPSPNSRVYGLNGALWPRIGVLVYRSRARGVSVSVETKASPGEWWSPLRSMPDEIARGLAELIVERLGTEDSDES